MILFEYWYLCYGLLNMLCGPQISTSGPGSRRRKWVDPCVGCTLFY